MPRARRQVSWDRVSAVEACVAVAALALALLNLLIPAWIEALTGWDPDRHGGAAEWLIAGALALGSAAAATAARRRLRAAASR
jgi:hypothetical protein